MRLDRLIFIICFLLPTISSASDFLPDREDQEIKMNDFIKLIEKNMVWRSQTEYFMEFIAKQEKKNGELEYVFTNEDIRNIHERGVEEYVGLREKLLDNVNDAVRVVKENITVRIGEKRPTERAKDGSWYYINPTDSAGRYYILRAKRAFAAGLVLFDNFLVSIYQCYEWDKTRQLINTDNEFFPHYLQEVADNFYSYETRIELNRAAKLYKKILAWERKNTESTLVKTATKEQVITWRMGNRKNLNISDAANNRYLNNFILNSFAYQKRYSGDASWIKRFWILNVDRIVKHRIEIKDLLKEEKDGIMYAISKFFGNTMGSDIFEKRKGVMLALSDKEEKQVISELRPLDVLLEKTPFRATDGFIPGHWGHVAVWVGNETQLKELGVWDLLDELYEEAKRSPARKYTGPSFKELIKSGHNIVEALRPGVQINSMRHFLNIDDLGVIRSLTLNKEEKVAALVRAFRQIGKEYDFNRSL